MAPINFRLRKRKDDDIRIILEKIEKNPNADRSEFIRTAIRFFYNHLKRRHLG